MSNNYARRNSRFSSPIKHSNRRFTKDLEFEGGQRRVVFFLVENFSMASFTSAIDVLVTANLLTIEPIFKTVTASSDGGVVSSDLGIDISVDTCFSEIDLDRNDIIVVCGGLRAPLIKCKLINKLVKSAISKGLWIGSLWNGAFFFCDALDLDQQEFSIHPDSREIIKEYYPNFRISKESNIIDGKFFSSVGSNSSIRVMLNLIEILFGIDIKRGVNGILIGDNNRPLNSAEINGVGFIPEKLKNIIELMENNLEEPLPIEDFSIYTSLSRRQVERLFSRYLNTSPSRYYLELRLNKGRELLLKTNYSVGDVSVACGFLTATHFSHSFKMVFGASPTSVRFEGKEIH
ncbi:GlxA family transcriptional regulator [Marinobacterium lutimaris]|uniref:Transcriptional regulator GlxA family, contains an amidase domain and an AraC-type DNA-binding HTH domain n=1 Tax=Marinobacterium lutimaris TaxID=568106 RepID=A0A1H5VDK7_9GAMM|nr:helix-turn-helix domain-containing protein [Marinobacterium lutimaris]SEF85399.1 Transcriptional regulator GlxA family, contains an amidase domain and an AraC-type DNA-binding HTH domain [Marinobacterium lutimaris]